LADNGAELSLVSGAGDLHGGFQQRRRRRRRLLMVVVVVAVDLGCR